jgi:hypothetical protein
MSVLIRVRNKAAILRHGIWVSADAALERELNATLNGWIAETGGPALSDADPELTAAKEVTRRVEGRIALRSPSKLGAGVYVAKRQMKFNFDAIPAVALSRRAPKRRVAALPLKRKRSKASGA